MHRDILIFNEDRIYSQRRRFEKKVSVAGSTTLRERYLYKGYLQVAAFDVAESEETLNYALERIIYWDPTESVATRPLAINITGDGLYFPTVDLTKNVCELVDAYGDIVATYDYAPFGAVTAGTPSGSAVPANPLQWSSEIYDDELGLVYYNYRHYSPSLGRFLSRDPIQEQGGLNLYAFVGNACSFKSDYVGWTISYEVLNRSIYGLTNHMPIFPSCEKIDKCKWSLLGGDVVSTPPTVATNATYTLRGSDGYLYRAECRRLPEGMEATKRHEEAHIQNMQNAIRRINSNFSLPKEFDSESSCQEELEKISSRWSTLYDEAAYNDKKHLGGAPQPSEPTFHQENAAGLCVITQL